MKKWGKFLSLLLVVLMTATLIGGCGKGETKESTKEVPNDTKEASDSEVKEMPKELTMYIGVVEEQALVIATEFEKATGIKVNFVRMSGGETMGRITAEKENPIASVWYGGPADSFIAAKNQDLLLPYVSPNAEVVDDRFKDKEGYWTGIYQGLLGFVCDGRYFEENNLELPTTWGDLLKPEFEKRIIVANPGSSGTAYTLLSTMVQLKGEEEGIAYMDQLDKQIKQYTKSGSAPAKSAALGEAAIGITFIHNGLRHYEEGFTNIQLSLPTEGTGYEIGAMAILNGAPELEAAKIFIDWALTTDAQELGQKNGSFQFLTNPNAQPPEKVMKFKDANLIDYDLVWSGDNRERLLGLWNDAVKSK